MYKKKYVELFQSQNYDNLNLLNFVFINLNVMHIYPIILNLELLINFTIQMFYNLEELNEI